MFSVLHLGSESNRSKIQVTTNTEIFHVFVASLEQPKWDGQVAHTPMSPGNCTGMRNCFLFGKHQQNQQNQVQWCVGDFLKFHLFSLMRH